MSGQFWPDSNFQAARWHRRDGVDVLGSSRRRAFAFFSNRGHMTWKNQSWRWRILSDHRIFLTFQTVTKLFDGGYLKNSELRSLKNWIFRTDFTSIKSNWDLIRTKMHFGTERGFRHSLIWENYVVQLDLKNMAKTTLGARNKGVKMTKNRFFGYVWAWG